MAKKRNYAGQLAYQKREQPRKDQAARQRARRAWEKAHGKKTPPGTELHHKQPLMRGGSNSQANLAVAPVRKNRGYPRDRNNRPK